MIVEQHLILKEWTLPPSSEQLPIFNGWLMARIVEGQGYWLQPGAAASQLSVGDGFITTNNTTGMLRASQLGSLKLQFFTIQPQHLNGILTITEWYQFEIIDSNPSSIVLLFTATDAVGQKFTRLAGLLRSDLLPMRCALFQLWAAATASLLPVRYPDSGNGNKLRTRFWQLIGHMTKTEFCASSPIDLAEQLHCSERHFRCLFRKEFGVSLHTYQSELRLQHPGQLLADSNFKITPPTYANGRQHPGFLKTQSKKRFGAAPGQWRSPGRRTKQAGLANFVGDEGKPGDRAVAKSRIRLIKKKSAS